MISWSKIKKGLSETSGYPDEYFELLADFGIIELCAKGLSNTDIASILELDELSVKFILTKHLNFSGFEERLTFSPVLWRTDLDVVNTTEHKNELLEKIVDTYIIYKERLQQYESSRF